MTACISPTRGGQVFAYWNNDVKQFLIDNAKFFYEEYRIDGLRFDEVSVMDRFGGWPACQAITGTLRYVKPEAIQVAEYWPVNPAIVRSANEGGAGFDAPWQDELREAVRGAIAQSAGGWNASVDMGRIAGALESQRLPARWQSVQCVENHDIIKRGEGQRIPRLADASDSRSWYARSRSRVATGLLMTAPSIPMLFMGQEFLEDKQFSDDPHSGNLLWWAGLEGLDGAGQDKAMSDHLRFTTDLIRLRWQQPAFCDGNMRLHYGNVPQRFLAFDRSVEDLCNVVVIRPH